MKERYQHSNSALRKVLCEEVQAQDRREENEWRERYRRAARRLANIEQLCTIEHEEKGKWLIGDGKGRMRVQLRTEKLEEVTNLLNAFDQLQQNSKKEES
eukprot:TRINITY_DN13792_c0_g1_i1.p1 TRINITY_DN13792_c0_g1~~TRINITY_DN13792_c0_g1_i1.p1  ORF type:complete len:100 (+),score=27.09 TRINITY_DN13792_c0_g1_i1:211-510(+)